jgi:hypothetical protein
MAADDIRIVDLGDGTAVWVHAGGDADPPRRRRRWPLWAAIGVALPALGGALALLL